MVLFWNKDYKTIAARIGMSHVAHHVTKSVLDPQPVCYLFATIISYKGMESDTQANGPGKKKSRGHEKPKGCLGKVNGPGEKNQTNS